MSFVKKARFKNRGRVVSGIAGIFTAAMLVFALVSCGPGVDPAPAPVVPVITITSQPAETTTVAQGDISGTLSVAAEVTEGAALSYRWYFNTSDSNQGGEAVTGATGANFTIPTDLTEGTYYYFCEASAAGADSVRSEAAKVTVKASGTVIPVITIKTQPAETTTVTQGSISGTLSVAAEVKPAAALSYRWYSNTEASNQGGEAIAYAKAASFTVPVTLTEGTYYYYCEVMAAGADAKRTNVATVKVNPVGTPPVPVITITTQPAETITVTEGNISGTLSVEAEVTEGAALAYQWYSNTEASNQDGEAIADAKAADFTIPAALTEGTYYYYCEVMAEGADTIRSNAATVVVNAEDAPIDLELDTWADGYITTENGMQLFRFTETADTDYVHVRFGGIGPVYVGLADSRGNLYYGEKRLSDETGSSSYYNLPSMGNGAVCYIRVRPSIKNDSGSYRIGINNSSRPCTTKLTPDTWADGYIYNHFDEEWFSFTAVPNMRIHMNITSGYGIEAIVDGKTISLSNNSDIPMTLTSGQVYYIRALSFLGYETRFRIALNTSIIPPETSPTELTAGTWADVVFPEDKTNPWFRFTATDGTQFIHTSSGAVYVYDSNGKEVSNTESGVVNSGVAISITSGQVYYIKVSNTDIDKICFSDSPVPPGVSPTVLTADTWADGMLPEGGKNWFSFTATADKQYIHASERTLTIRQQLYDSEWNTIGDLDYLDNYTSLSVTSGQVYYLKISSYSDESGTYKIGFSASPVPIGVSPYVLTADTWADGMLPQDGENWFSFTATANTQYIYVSFGTLANISVGLYDSNEYFGSNSLVGSTGNTDFFSESVVSGNVYYIRVHPYNGSGTYKIGFSASPMSIGVLPTVLTANTWADGMLPQDGENWFSFTATANTQYIHAKFGGLTEFYVQVFDSAWQMVGMTSLSSSSYYKYSNISGLSSGQTYYIKVMSYSSNDFGTYDIAFNTSTTPPAN